MSIEHEATGIKPATPAPHLQTNVHTQAREAMARVMGWQYLVRYSGMPPEWMDSVLDALASAALADGRGVPARCTCLHPGWPQTPCSLHPDVRPNDKEQNIAFRKQWDARVET